MMPYTVSQRYAAACQPGKAVGMVAKFKIAICVKEQFVAIGVAQHKKRKAELKKAKGYVGGRSKLRRIAQGAVTRAEVTATHDRKKRKGDFRRLWITRLNAAVRALDMTYSRFVEGLTKANIGLDRKTLSEMAIHDADAFRQVVGVARAALG